MNSKRRPDVKLFAKRKSPGDGPEYVDLGAFWREDGRLSGGWDKRIKGVTVHLEDGSRVRVSAADYWLNAREDSGDPGERRGKPSEGRREPQRSSGRTRRDDPPPDSFVDDDIPF